MKRFVADYLGRKEALPLNIYDLGSSAIGGSYRSFLDKEHWLYTGIDLTPGENVDLVLSDPYNWLEIKSNSIDVLVSGQTFEHIEFFWRTILEIARVLKPEGLCCIIAPSRGPEHKYPVDCWRFYPDGLRSLARYANLEVLEASTQKEDLGYPDGSDEWGDTVLVARKPSCEDLTKKDSPHIYRRQIESDDENSLSKIVPLVTPGSRVLELGPATGYLTAHLKNELKCRVDCVELSAQMAAESQKFCERMVVADLDAVGLIDYFEPGSYDCIILADILEHLKEDAGTLKACRALLKPEGRCLISIPNIGHASVVGQLLKERFNYTQEGLLDKTHLRFYTRHSIVELLHRCGFSVDCIDPLIKLPEDTETGDALIDFPHAVQKAIYSRQDALCYQFVITCSKEGGASERQPSRQSPISPVDLRKAFTESLNHRIAELTDLSMQRLEQIQAMDIRLSKENEALQHAQKLAWERLDQVTTLESTITTLQAEIEKFTSSLLYRADQKVKRLLDRAGINSKKSGAGGKSRG